MNIGNKTRTIKARFPLLNTVVLVLALVMNAFAVLTTALDNYIFLGIPIKFVLPIITLGLMFVVAKGLLAYKNGDHIELYERGVKCGSFESTYKDLVVRRNSLLETITLSNGKEDIVFKGYITNRDYLALRNL